MRGRDGIQRAAFETKSAPLSSDFGRKVAEEKFGAELVGRFPTFTRGPRKGMLKGYLCWTKCTVGGWARSHPEDRSLPGVVKPGTSGWRITMAHPDSDPNGHAIVARWTYARPAPVVENLQTPEAAEQLHKTYGTDKRYG